MKLRLLLLKILLILSINYTFANNEEIQHWEKQALEGDHKAQANLGYIYLNGWKTIKKDYKKAFNWYTKAANGNVFAAQNNLGHMYEHGYGVRQNLETALIWYKKAADQNDMNGQYNAGVLLIEKIDDSPENRREGLKYLIKSKKLGNFSAEFIIGKTYIVHNIKISDGPQNLKEAISWIENAANKGNKKAIEYLIFLYKGNSYGIPASKKNENKWKKKLKGK